MEIRKERQERATKLTLFLDSEPVSHLWVIDYDMRIGSSSVRMGGIAGVWTEEKHRLKGYASRVLNYSNEFMKEEGYDVSLLFGIPNFYHRFGYATVLPWYTARLETKHLSSLPQGLKVESFKPRFKEALLHLYNVNNATRTGTLVRSPDKWETFTHGSGWDSKAIAYVLVEHEEVVAYIVGDEKGDPFIIEVGYKEPSIELFSSLLAQIKLYTEERNSTVVTLSLPPDDPFMEFCQRYDLKLTIEYPLNRDGMGRIINIKKLFSKIQQTLETRLLCNHIEGKLAIRTEIGDVFLDIDKESLVISSASEKFTWELTIPQHKLMQLIMGYRSVGDVLLDSDVYLNNPQAVPLLVRLFPKGFPHLSLPDRF